MLLGGTAMGALLYPFLGGLGMVSDTILQKVQLHYWAISYKYMYHYIKLNYILYDYCILPYHL